ncbi:protoporphyrinogen oxidase [Nakamurella leprariae]|uniref:Coproporphyrinogen III oxidase n=1 Tax=Nakamurella leprariae TaxID=2803911 RepID=A0A938YB29_9ACTN|nr:protoporphyrinogen oxidase [Nakamurella leprariae]MBM9467342.1 protoporphyrinogen oxidase [Nakamurella leprariae]
MTDPTAAPRPVDVPVDVPVAVDVAVVGGGISGLLSGWDLARAGLRVVVLERSDHPGGAVSSHVLAGLTLDAGADSFATARPAVRELIDELGMGDRVVSPDPRGAWVQHTAGPAPLPRAGLLGIPGRPWAADVRRAVGWVGAARATLDRVLPASVGTSDHTPTVGSLVRARMGRRVLDRLVGPVAGGVYAADPDVLEVRTVAPTLLEQVRSTGSLAAAVREVRGVRPGAVKAGSAADGLTGGMHTLATGLAAAAGAAGVEIRCDVDVLGLTPSDAGGWRVRLQPGGTLDVRAVVLAAPGPVTAGLVQALATDGALPREAVDAVRTPSSEVLLASLVIRSAALDGAPRGTGVLVAEGVRTVRAKALTHATAKWRWLAEAAGPGRHVLRLSYGRTADGSDLPDEADLPEIARRDAEVLLGVPLPAADVEATDVIRWTSALPTPVPGHRAAVAALRERLADRDVAVVGAFAGGTGLAAVVADTRTAAAALAVRLQP